MAGKLLALLLALPAATFAVTPSDAAAPAAGASSNASAPVFEPCQIQNLTGIVVYNADCTDIEVAENPAKPDGRRIKLRVAVVPAINRRKSPDPVFLLAGGPGMGATVLYGNAAPAFTRIHRDRDIVLVDQRGTGSSNPLNCEIAEDLAMLSDGTDELIAENRRCLEELGKRADVAYYTTSLAVQDLDHVRAVLGYERINLYGGSYGTRVAQHYLRKFPQRTRAVILDGVVAPEQLLGPEIALDAENALLNVLNRCARDEACRKQFGDPVATYRALRTSLESKPVTVSFTDPSKGSPSTMEFGAMHLAVVLRLSTYSTEQAALLPLAMHLAQRSGNFAPLAGQFLLTIRSLADVLSYGMSNSVTCTEDVSLYTPASFDLPKLRTTFMGTAQIDALQALCKDWPLGPRDADLHEPLKSSVPVLLLSGGNDPVTPPANADLARKGLTNSLHLVLPDLGHGQIGAPCMDSVMAQFIARANVNTLDTSCTQRAKPMPFFTTLAGPPP